MRNLVANSHDSEFPISVQCNVINFIGRPQDIITILIVGCRQMKTLKKLLHLEFLIHKEHKIQKQQLKGVWQKWSFDNKTSSEV